MGMTEEVGSGKGAGTGIEEVDLPERVLADIQDHAEKDARRFVIVESRLGQKIPKLRQNPVDIVKP